MHRRSPALLVVLALVGLVVPVATVPVATVSSAVVDDRPPARLQLVLDSSGSMREATQGGTKLAVAKKALARVVRDLPPDAEAGLRVYGATVDSGPGACTDSQEVVPPGLGNRADLLRAVRDYRALGETPIGHALEQAAKDLGDDGRRTIVLVSDGEPTCEPDPCEVARDLTKQGIDLKIDVIGLDVGAEVRSQLECIAENGNGTYYDADDVTTLTQSLTQLSTRAFRPFQVSGLAVEGTPDAASAPEIGPGQYVDAMPMGTLSDDTGLSYRVPRTVPGSTLHVGVTVRAPRGFLGSTYVDLLNEGGSTCGDDISFNAGVFGRRALLTTSAASWRPDPADACNTDDVLTVRVAHSDDDLAGAPFELVVYEEPPLARDGQALPPAETGAVWEPMEPGRRARAGVVPGTGVSDAPVLEVGTYSMAILADETQVFAVPVGWGQRLQAQAVIPPLRGALAGTVSDIAGMEMRIFGPVREQVYANMPVRGEPGWDSLFQFTGDAEPFTVGAVTPTVRYLNRAELGTRSASLPGYRFVEVNFSAGVAEHEPYLVPYTLTVQTFGTAGEGAPAYDDGTLAAPPVPPPADLIASAGLPPAGTPTASPATAPSGSPEADAAEEPAAATTHDGGSSSSLLGWGVGVLAVLLLGSVAVLLLRRRAG